MYSIVDINMSTCDLIMPNVVSYVHIFRNMVPYVDIGPPNLALQECSTNKLP